MYPVSTTLQAALAAGTPQRVLLEFNDITFSNEGIVIGTGIELNEVFSGETDIRAGLCPSGEIRFDLLNDRGQLNEFAFGTFKAWLGARIDTGTPAANAKTKVFMEDGVPRTYEFTPLGVDKTRALKRTFEVLGIDRSEVMSFGDAQNDLSMIEWAQVGVAMGNAAVAVREQADYVTLDNNHDGIAHALEELVPELLA